MGHNADLVFAIRTGGTLDAANVRREFKAACRAAEIGDDWTPRELRHSFGSLMSNFGSARRGDRAAGWALQHQDGRSGLQT
ncbi:MAG: tyrosine-type recombinase/integrase [Trebonia sp.]